MDQYIFLSILITKNLICTGLHSQIHLLVHFTLLENLLLVHFELVSHWLIRFTLVSFWQTHLLVHFKLGRFTLSDTH